MYLDWRSIVAVLESYCKAKWATAITYAAGNTANFTEYT